MKYASIKPIKKKIKKRGKNREHHSSFGLFGKLNQLSDCKVGLFGWPGFFSSISSQGSSGGVSITDTEIMVISAENPQLLKVL